MNVDAGVIRDWLKKEEHKSKVARSTIRSGCYKSGQQLFLLERAQKAEATARVLRKVLKLLANGDCE
jgi:hypothetical protein